MNYDPTEIYSKIMTHIMPYLYNVCSSHGILHMRTVFEHAIRAIEVYHNDNTDDLSDEIKSAIVIAAFLHDIDDRKFFNTTNYDNARQIIRDIGYENLEDLIIKMITYVSSSKNRNDVTDECKQNPWLLIPRYCDRIEAIGIIGLERTYRYTKTINRKLFDENTMRIRSKEELFSEKILYRYDTYVGESNTMIDHMYDKLLHICRNKVDNKYIDDIIEDRNDIMINFCIKFGNGEFEDETEMETYILNLKKSS